MARALSDRFCNAVQMELSGDTSACALVRSQCHGNRLSLPASRPGADVTGVRGQLLHRDTRQCVAPQPAETSRGGSLVVWLAFSVTI